MPYRRAMGATELRMYAIFDRRLTAARLATVEAAVAAGSELLVECSTMTDPGPDYTRVLLDGVEIARAQGY